MASMSYDVISYSDRPDERRSRSRRRGRVRNRWAVESCVPSTIVGVTFSTASVLRSNLIGE